MLLGAHPILHISRIRVKCVGEVIERNAEGKDTGQIDRTECKERTKEGINRNQYIN
jgi:hypothetical protein